MARASEWAHNGSYLNRPSSGWLHSNEKLQPSTGGIIYSVRYIGSLDVKVSMKSLDFDTRTDIAKACIDIVANDSGLTAGSKRKKIDKSIAKCIGTAASLRNAGANVKLSITTDAITVEVLETGEIILKNEMPGISFASGGDSDAMDFVAYVAKDMNGRYCYVFECGPILAQDVITTIGQAFELRFKEYLRAQPKPLNVPSRDSLFHKGSTRWGDAHEPEEEAPPPPPPPARKPPGPPTLSEEDVMLQNEMNLHKGESFKTESEVTFNNQLFSPDIPSSKSVKENTYYEKRSTSQVPEHNLVAPKQVDLSAEALDPVAIERDAFDMRPFNPQLPSNSTPAMGAELTPADPVFGLKDEEWFHGPLSRKEAEELLKRDGDFLVRSSTSSSGQYVLSGRHKGVVKHLLLIDPDGIVRTRDRRFDSISHLINFHMHNGVPIVSQDSELILKFPVSSQC